MVEGFLWQVLVVQPHVAQQRFLQVLCAVEMMRTQHLLNPAVEAFDHAVGLRRTRPCQAVFNAQSLTQRVELMLTTCFLYSLAKQPVGEFLAVIGQKRANPERRSARQRVQEGLCSGCRLAVLDCHEYPARSAVDGHEDVAPCALVSHLRQVLHVHMHVTRLVGLERLVRAFGLVGHRKARMPASAQQPVQRRAAHRRLNELPDHGEQIVQRQTQMRTQVDHQFLLACVERALQAMRRVAAVGDRVSLAPFADRVARDVELPGKLVIAAGGILDRFADGGRRGGVLVQVDQHVVSG